MAERIYARRDGGRIEPLEEERFSAEDDLQALIADHPELLDGEQVRPGDPRRWILITREKGIAESSDSGARWSLDHLMVDQDAVPTLVEVKLGSNPEIRRTVVGQMLEYAAHASHTWTAAELRRTFEESAAAAGRDPGDLLGELLQSDTEPDADAFWEDVSRNLAARHLRLLFVADQIPDPLERVIEFLNAQMSTIEVLAVEIKQFRSRSTQTLVPRVLGRIASVSGGRAGGRSRKLTPESFLAEFTADQAEARRAAERLLEVARGFGAALEWGPSGVSVRGRCSRWQWPITVAWLYPPSKAEMGWMRTRDFTFGVGILDYDDPAPEEGLRTVLERYADGFGGLEFTTDASSKGVKAWAVDSGLAAQHIDLLADRLSSILSELQRL